MGGDKAEILRLFGHWKGKERERRGKGASWILEKGNSGRGKEKKLMRGKEVKETLDEEVSDRLRERNNGVERKSSERVAHKSESVHNFLFDLNL